MLKLVWREDARAELRDIITYISDLNLSAAEGLKQAIEATAEKLPDHPLMYRVGRVAGTREALVHPNYILIYRVTADAVEILSVLHARQAYP